MGLNYYSFKEYFLFTFSSLTFRMYNNIVHNFVIKTDFKIHTGLPANLQTHSQFSSEEERLGLKGTGPFPERDTKNMLSNTISNFRIISFYIVKDENHH